MKDCDPEKSSFKGGSVRVREGGFALGLERGRREEEVGADQRRDGEQPKGECSLLDQCGVVKLSNRMNVKCVIYKDNIWRL